MPNDARDLWVQITFLWPYDFPLGNDVSYMRYAKNHGIGKWKNTLEPLFTRTKKSDLGLPKPEPFEKYYVDLQPIQSEIYNAMQTGVLDAANTSSSSFVSYRIYEQVKCYTPAGDVALWFMYQPMLMNKSTFEALNEEQQAALLDAAAKAQAFYLEEAKKEDAASADVFREAGVEIATMSQADFDAWRALAQKTSYAKFVEDTPDGQKLLDMALAVE